ncbi:T6SS effector amidase Tae4 family protein [Kalamiella sp. sgz302252]|uniref:T6SS effector amidase Tae4 family protein n=1 Tax=Pantoea sp. sgz302252 TaxID=3341827 RepID=UPI0036D420C8
MTTITARSGNSTSSLNVKRPSWASVYAGYPKVNGGTDFENDLNGEEVFISIFGPEYDKVTFVNACGTRVSLALLSAGFKRVGKRKIMITEKSHKHYGKYIEPGAARLKDFLISIWGRPEHKILYPGSIDKVNAALKGKKGIYIMIPKSPAAFNATGHATLWTGKGAIGNNHYITEKTAEIYLWELK